MALDMRALLAGLQGAMGGQRVRPSTFGGGPMATGGGGGGREAQMSRLNTPSIQMGAPGGLIPMGNPGGLVYPGGGDNKANVLDQLRQGSGDWGSHLLSARTHGVLPTEMRSSGGMNDWLDAVELQRQKVGADKVSIPKTGIGASPEGSTQFRGVSTQPGYLGINAPALQGLQQADKGLTAQDPQEVEGQNDWKKDPLYKPSKRRAY